MVDAAASLLDELMGRFRNEDPEKMNKKLKWNDEDVCQFYCLRFCPNDLFTNTRADLGPCRKIHDEDAKESFKSAAAYEKRQLEDEFIRYAGNLLRDVDRKIAKGKERLALALQTEAMNLPPNLQRESKEKVALLTEKINKLISEAEEMGSEGKVEEAQGLLRLADNLKEEKERLQVRNAESLPWMQTAELAAQQEKQMEVCEICGAFLIVGDAQSRIDDHLMGKLHLGFAQLRVAVEEITEERKKAEELREKERAERRRDRDRERPPYRRRSRDRTSRDKDRERRRSRDRSRDRDGKSRDRDGKSRDRDRGRRRDDRDHRGSSRSDRDRDRRRRSRSRSRSHRDSRSRSSRRRSRTPSRDRERKRRSSKSPGEKRERRRSDEKRRSEEKRRSREKSSSPKQEDEAEIDAKVQGDD